MLRQSTKSQRALPLFSQKVREDWHEGGFTQARRVVSIPEIGVAKVSAELAHSTRSAQLYNVPA